MLCGTNAHQRTWAMLNKTVWVEIMIIAVLLMSFSSVRGISEESYDYTVTVTNELVHFVPRPDLGYVVKAHKDPAAIEAMGKVLREDGAEDIRPIKGLGRTGICVVQRQRADDENKMAIAKLRTRTQIAYTAPLFSLNGETIAIIPEIVVRLESADKSKELDGLCTKLGLTIKKKMEFTKLEYLLEVTGDNADAVFASIERLNSIRFVDWAYPNVAFEPKLCGQFIPNDEYFPHQWYLNNTGQSGGTPHADISATGAWEVTSGDPNIVIAILDNGVDLSHLDLIANLVAGYDFYEDDNEPAPSGSGVYEGHGTSCAGLAAAQGNNSIGVTGVACNCKIMPISIAAWPSPGLISAADIAAAFRWAANNGADVLSNSWGVNISSPVVDSAIEDITEQDGMGRDGKGCVVFFAVGNEGTWIRYPAKHPAVISIGATDESDVRWDYSNHGPELDMTAPSSRIYLQGDIWTTDITGVAGRNNRDANILDYTDMMGGTSSATPIAAGVAALILSVEPNLTNLEVRNILERSAVDLGDPGWDEYYGHGRVDARAAVEMVLRTRVDLDGDSRVDFKDVSRLAEEWLEYNSAADIVPGPYNERKVDYSDFAIMGKNWLISTEVAWGPNPEDGATSVVVEPDITLSWIPGDIEMEGYTVSYIVNLGIDQASLAGLDTVESTRYEVSGLDPSTTYYWRIDTKRKLNSPPFNTLITPGNIWSFTAGP